MQSLFSKFKVKDRHAAFIQLFPEKFKLEANEVSIATDNPPVPHPEGMPCPYEEKRWRELGMTPQLAAEVCIMTGRPCLVMHNTTLIFQKYPE